MRKDILLVVTACILLAVILVVWANGNKPTNSKAVSSKTQESFRGSAGADHWTDNASIPSYPVPTPPDKVPIPTAPHAYEEDNFNPDMPEAGEAVDEPEVPEADGAIINTEALTNSKSDSSDLNDEYGMFVVPENKIEEGFFVERNGKLYSISSYVGTDVIDKYGVGFEVVSGTGIATLFRRDYNEMKLPTENKFCFITAGDIPIMQVKKSEEIRSYGSNTTLSIMPSEFIGYTIDVISHVTEIPSIDHNLSQKSAGIATDRKEQVGVYAGEEQVADVRNLNYGQEYVFSWFHNTQYHEYKMKAVCKAFKGYSPYDTDGLIKLEGELDKNGYARFNLSELDPGLYCCSIWPAVFEVVE